MFVLYLHPVLNLIEKQQKIFWKDMINNPDREIKLDSYVPDPNKKRKVEGDYVSDFKLDVNF